MLQTTIAHEFTFTGIGLHTGHDVSVTCTPAPADTGLEFRLDTPGGEQRVRPAPSSVIATALATTIGNEKASVSTVEHLLAALRGMGVDNCVILAREELPFLDGSAAQFADRIDQVGLTRLDRPRRMLRVTKPVELRDGSRRILAYPVNTPGAFRVNYLIDFPHPAIGVQQLSLDVTPQKFFRVANARSFGFVKDVEYMHAHGLALGGSMENAIVLDDTRVLNPEGLRSKDEFVRHKILDFIGDMAMARLPLQGNFTVARSGHRCNNLFLRKMEETGALEEVVLEGGDAVRQLRLGRVSKPAFATA